MSSNKFDISIIIPVHNEQKNLRTFIRSVRERQQTSSVVELIVVDGQSTDDSALIAALENTTVINSAKGRAMQMNAGAAAAKGNILYFLHADTLPPFGFDNLILDSAQRGFEAGCFSMKFDSNSRILKFFSWFTRFNFLLFRGGDQSLFVHRDCYDALGGYKEEYIIYEDCEFISRLYKSTDFHLIRVPVITSARKYHALGVLYLQFHFGIIHLKNLLGKPPQDLHAYYQKRIGSRLA